MVCWGVMIMAIVVFFVSTITFAICGLFFVNKNQRLKKRIERFIPQESRRMEVPAAKAEATADSQKVTLKYLIENLSKNIKPTENQRNKIETELQSAGIPLKVEEFITIRIVLFGVVILVALLSGIQAFLAILIGLIGWKLPSIYLKRKKEKRISVSSEQLPQALETMANAMKSGFSFLQAMQLVAKESPDPIGIEFQRTLKEMNLGISHETAFENLLQRLPNRDLEIVVTAVLIQRTTGGNLAQILETIHETISERVRMKDELKALTSQGRMSALVITLLPVFLGVFLNLLNHDYFSPMLSHPLGWVLLGGGVLSGILGWIFIHKIVTVEV
jgi:tight adherence protein B